MLLYEFVPGNKVILFITRNGKRYQITSKIVDSERKKKVYIILIAQGSQAFHFLPTDKVEVIYTYKTRMWLFQNVIGNVEFVNNQMVHSLTFPTPPKIYNRRQVFRVPLSLELMLHRYVQRENAQFYALIGEPSTVVKKFLGVVKDISENGVGILAHEDLDIGETVGFVIPNRGNDLDIKFEIIRKGANTEGRFKRAYGGIITESNYEDLKKFVLEEQRRIASQRKD
ncbi:MAG: PilZ domain-containing protein [Lachnospiraceae bacterium]|nr:PilZ domain-containing protein [Lachnospiraceae bacterium]